MCFKKVNRPILFGAYIAISSIVVFIYELFVNMHTLMFFNTFLLLSVITGFLVLGIMLIEIGEIALKITKE
jgi:hypothetical protein